MFLTFFWSAFKDKRVLGMKKKHETLVAPRASLLACRLKVFRFQL